MNTEKQHNYEDDDANRVTDDWQLWCRLCAREDPEGNISIALKDEDAAELDDEVANIYLSLGSSIEKYFSLQINYDDNLPKMLCAKCFSLITSLFNFSERVEIVQQMLLTLQENSQSSNTVNVKDIRLKYGLLDEDGEHNFLQEHAPETLYLGMNTKPEGCVSDIENHLEQKMKGGNTSEGVYGGYDDADRAHNLDESLKDVPSSPKKKPRRSKRNNKKQSDTSLTHTKKIPTQQHYKCPQCSRICKWKRDYEVHLLTHLPDEQKNRFPCSHCGKKFITKFRVTQHIRLAHMDDRPFACDKCGKTFKENRYLKHHMETHNPNKHVCAKCGLQLNSVATLNRHLLVHSDERKHKCDYCGRAFKFSKNLKDHLLLHTNLRPYSCNFCNRSYNSASACRAHKKNAHPEELADLEATGGGKTHTSVPTLEVLKTIAKTACKSKNYGTNKNSGVKYRVNKFPTSENNDRASETPIDTDYEYDVNPNRVRYTFTKK